MQFIHYILAWFEERRVAKMTPRERFLEDLNALWDKGYTFALATIDGVRYRITKTPEYDDVYMGGMGEFEATARGSWHSVMVSLLEIRKTPTELYAGSAGIEYTHNLKTTTSLIHNWSKQSYASYAIFDAQLDILKQWFHRMKDWKPNSGVRVWSTDKGDSFYLTKGSFKGEEPTLDTVLCLMSANQLLEVTVRDLGFLSCFQGIPKCDRFLQFVPECYKTMEPSGDDDRFIIIDTHKGSTDTAAYVVVNDEEPDGVKSITKVRIRIIMDEYMKKGTHLELCGFVKQLTHALRAYGVSLRGELYLRNVAIVSERKSEIYNMEQWSKLSQDKHVFLDGTISRDVIKPHGDFLIAFDTTGINFKHTAY